MLAMLKKSDIKMENFNRKLKTIKNKMETLKLKNKTTEILKFDTCV